MEDLKKVFKQVDINTPAFSLKGIKTYARLISQYDGDTITCLLPIFNTYFKFQIRLMGIDTCEIKSKSTTTKDLAIKARNRLLELVTGVTPRNIQTKKQITDLLNSDVYLVYLECYDFDKWGRVLADVYTSKDAPKSISQILLDEKLAYPYAGETKLTEDEQISTLT